MKEFEYLGSRISECRQNKNMTQEEMARRLAVTPQALSKWERGQSYPDIAILADICAVLEVSADYLLGVEQQKIEKEENHIMDGVWWNCLINCLEPFALDFGKDLLSLFYDKDSEDNEEYIRLIRKLRVRLSTEGILLPIVKIEDNLVLKPMEFMIWSFGKVLYSEELEKIDENTLKYMFDKMEEAVRKNYSEIISPDMIRAMADNLRRSYPALIEGVVPEKISYLMLTEIMREFLRRGNSMAYFPKVIEYSENILRRNPNLTIEKLTDEIIKKIQPNNEFIKFIAKRG